MQKGYRASGAVYMDVASGNKYDTCDLCGIGTYSISSESDASTCKVCDVDRITLGLGASSESECLCKPGYYTSDGMDCEQCAAGACQSTCACAPLSIKLLQLCWLIHNQHACTRSVTRPICIHAYVHTCILCVHS